MSIWTRLLGTKPAQPIDDEGNVSAAHVVSIIRERASAFTRSQGMVVVIQTVYRVRLYFFDGVKRCSWNYDYPADEFTADRVGLAFLRNSPVEVTLQPEELHKLRKTLQRDFRGHDLSMKALHLDGLYIDELFAGRISFE
jgi:hypothetical protein